MSLMWNFICIFARKIINYMPMDNRNTVQLNSLVGWLRLPPSRLGHSSKLDGSRCSVGCLGNSSATGLKNKMKESKASERKTTQQSLFFHLLFFMWREYGDTVLNYIRKYPSFNAHSGLSMKYDLISDSIRTELLSSSPPWINRLPTTWKFTEPWSTIQSSF